MAGDWIKMRTVLQTSPKVVRIASALKADRLKTVGGLYAVWCLFDAHSEDGRLSGYTPEVLDEMIGWDGFSRALEAVRWLTISPEFLELPDFEIHNGQSAKRRAQEADRKRESRKTSASKADKSVTREEKRREDITNTSSEVLAGQTSRKKFAKPTLDELITEFTGKVTHPEIEANKFLNHYESVGWKVGKNPMKSWKHSVTNWITRRNENANSGQSSQHGFHSTGSPTKLSTVSRNSRKADALLEQIEREQAESLQSHGEPVEASR